MSNKIKYYFDSSAGDFLSLLYEKPVYLSSHSSKPVAQYEIIQLRDYSKPVEAIYSISDVATFLKYRKIILVESGRVICEEVFNTS